MTDQAYIIEVGPRDGLQNVKQTLTFSQKKNLIEHLINCGFTDVEAGSFVRFDKIPAMADSDRLALELKNERDKLWYLAPNLRGLQNALEHGVQQIAFFTAVSESFNQKNIGMSVEKSLQIISECLQYIKAENYELITNWNEKPTKDNQLKLRLYISTVIACPYDGWMPAKLTLDMINQVSDSGFSQISLGDTIGKGTPKNWKELISQIDSNLINNNYIAMHCHNTYGTALASVYQGLDLGIRSFDSSIGGLGGCPFAPGATGNLSTEDLIYLLTNEGFSLPIDLNLLHQSFNTNRTANLSNHSLVHQAYSAQKNKS